MIVLGIVERYFTVLFCGFFLFLLLVAIVVLSFDLWLSHIQHRTQLCIL